MAEPLRRPPALRPGDTVAVIATSGPADQERLDAGIVALECLGLDTEILASARATQDPLGGAYLAGEDAARAADITTALASPEYSAVFCARGGYGAQRALDLVDWDAVHRDRPRVVVGFSDVTALLEAVSARLGWVSLFGPMVSGEAFVQGSYQFDTLVRTLFEPATMQALRFPASRTLVPGTARGVTRGGTLSLLASSVGTPTSVPARGGIVLLEDVDEEPYRLDRFLTQMLRAGYFDGVTGVLAGSFSSCGDIDMVDRLLLDRLGDLGVPVLAGADIGHGVPQQTFPLGVTAELDTSRGALLLESPALA